MNDLVTEKRRLTVQKLSGFLAGVIALRGGIRQYSAFAYLLEDVPADTTPEEAIRERYRKRKYFVFDSAGILPGGTGEMERLIGAYLVGDAAHSEALAGQGRFAADRALDLVNLIFEGPLRKNMVYRLYSRGSEGESECTFLCIRRGSELLVMQFNDNSNFRPPADIPS